MDVLNYAIGIIQESKLDGSRSWDKFAQINISDKYQVNFKSSFNFCSCSDYHFGEMV